MADVDTTARYTTVRYTSYFLSRGACVQSLLSLRCMFAWSFCGNHPNTKQPWLQQLLAHAYASKASGKTSYNVSPACTAQAHVCSPCLQSKPDSSRLALVLKPGQAPGIRRTQAYIGAAEILFRKAVGSQKMLRTARCMHWRVKSSNDMRGHMGMQRHLYRLSSALDREPRRILKPAALQKSERDPDGTAHAASEMSIAS